MFCTYHFTSKCQALFFLNCKVVNNTLKILQMCYSWGVHAHMSCGCGLLAFHMLDKHDFIPSCNPLKGTLISKGPLARFSQMGLCPVDTRSRDCLFSHNWQVGVLLLLSWLLALSFPSQSQFLCFLLRSELKLNWESWSPALRKPFQTKRCAFCSWEQVTFQTQKKAFVLAETSLHFYWHTKNLILLSSKLTLVHSLSAGHFWGHLPFFAQARFFLEVWCLSPC